MTTRAIISAFRLKAIEEAQRAPVEISSVSRANFLDQELVTKNTKAILALGKEGVDVRVLDQQAYEHLMEVYKAILHYGSAYGQRYTQWFAEKKLCQRHNVPFDTPKPYECAPPADIAFTTMWIKEDEAYLTASAKVGKNSARRQQSNALSSNSSSPSVSAPVPTSAGLTSISTKAPSTSNTASVRSSSRRAPSTALSAAHIGTSHRVTKTSKSAPNFASTMATSMAPALQEAHQNSV